MFDRVFQAETLLAGEVADLEAGQLTGEDAASLLKVFTRIERLAGAARTKLAGRIEHSNIWRGGGHKTAASFLPSTPANPSAPPGRSWKPRHGSNSAQPPPPPSTPGSYP